MPNAALTTVIKKELGSEVQPRTLRGNEVEDSTGITREIVNAQGNITGATTFNVANGETVTATLTGNITVTLTAGTIKGQVLDLRLTQDATGSRTATWPANAKFGLGGSLMLSTAATTMDAIAFRWDGTNWQETNRTLAAGLPVVNGGTGATTSTGSGSVVLSASPTLTGTMTASAVTVSGVFNAQGGMQFSGTNGTIQADSSNMVVSGVNNVYIIPNGVDGTKIAMASGSLRVGGPDRTSASLNVYGNTGLSMRL